MENYVDKETIIYIQISLYLILHYDATDFVHLLPFFSKVHLKLWHGGDNKLSCVFNWNKAFFWPVCHKAQIDGWISADLLELSAFYT